MLARLCAVLVRHAEGSGLGFHEGALSAASRCLGEASTSYIPEPLVPAIQALQKRHMAKKAKKGAAPALPSLDGMVVTPPSRIQHPEHLARLQRLKMRRRMADHIPLPLDENQKELMKQVNAVSKDAATDEAEGPEEVESAGSAELKPLGIPLSQRDIVKLVHKSLSGAAGQNVHFRPYVFTNLFQSAPAVASYVANALELGTPWPRIERFFLSSVEADPGIGAIRVQVKGRLGRKATMASTKVWEHGQLSLKDHFLAVDHGMATAMTRVGILGIQVWVRYAGDAIANSMYRRNTGFSRPFIQLLAAKRDPLPYRSSSAWWNTPGPEQPAVNRTWEAFKPDYPSTTMPVATYLAANTPQLFRHDEDRKAAIATQAQTALQLEGSAELVTSKAKSEEGKQGHGSASG